MGGLISSFPPLPAGTGTSAPNHLLRCPVSPCSPPEGSLLISAGRISGQVIQPARTSVCWEGLLLVPYHFCPAVSCRLCPDAKRRRKKKESKKDAAKGTVCSWQHPGSSEPPSAWKSLDIWLVARGPRLWCEMAHDGGCHRVIEAGQLFNRRPVQVIFSVTSAG
jgi:hypothetical protein